MSKGF